LSDKSEFLCIVMGPLFRAQMVDGTEGEIQGEMQLTEKGLRLITKRGYRGLSAEFDIDGYTCSVCNQDYEECSHENVALIPKGLTGRAVGLVPNPAAGTYVADVLVIRTKRKRRHYRWIGYASGAGTRSRRIQDKLESGHLSSVAATVISKYFLARKSGECRYSERIQ